MAYGLVTTCTTEEGKITILCSNAVLLLNFQYVLRMVLALSPFHFLVFLSKLMSVSRFADC